MYISPGEFSEMLSRIEEQIALKQGVDRGWFSYTDLDALSRILDWNELLKNLGDGLLKVSNVYT